MQQLRRWGPLAVFALVPALLILGAVGPGQFLYGVDVVGTFYYLHGAIGQAFAEGRLPVWDPHVMAGFPVAAEPQAAVFYPPSLLRALLSAGTFCTVSVLLHQILAGLFAHRWLQRGLRLGPWPAMAGATLFLMSSYLAARIHGGTLSYIWAYAWFPALLWRLERYLAAPTLKRGTLLGAVLAMLFLSGVPQAVFFAGGLVFARLLLSVLSEREGRKERAKVAAAAVGWLALGILVCAPQILPTLELIREGQRGAVSNYEFVTSGSVAPGNFVTLLAPAFFGDGPQVPVWSHGAIWEATPFVGIAGLGLAALGAAGRHRQRFLWAGVALAAVLLSMGHHSPVFRLVYEIVPGAGLFRIPARYLILFTIAASALTAMGVERLLAGDPALRRHALRLAGIAALLMLTGAALRISLSGEPGWWTALVERERAAYRGEQKSDPAPASREASAKSLLWASLCAAAAGGSLLVRRGEAAAAALGLLMAGELWVYNSRYYVGLSRENMEWPREFVSNVRNHPRSPFRIATVAMAQTPAIGKCQMAGLDHIGGYEPMTLRRYAEVANVGRHKPASDPVVAMVFAIPNPLFDLLGARYWIVPGPQKELPGLKPVGQLGGETVYENLRALPRAFFAARTVVIESPEERLRFLGSPEFDPARVAVLESAAGAPAPGAEEIRGRVQLAAMEPGLYALKTDCPSEAVLVLAETMYPGWTVEVDGAPATLLRANHLVQAVRLPAGRHDVRFAFRSRFLKLGFAIAALAALFPAVLFALRKRKAGGERAVEAATTARL